MTNASHSLMNYLRTIAGAWRDDPRDDAELLARFADGHNEDAFRVLAWRHGVMVWQTCRRILGDTPDAEDSFQTVFLTLTRKAGRIRREPLAGWLYRVAQRVALNVDASARRRRSLERKIQTTIQQKASVKGDGGRAEQRGVLDEELAGLPEKLRVPLILHFLEEKTQNEVARILGCSQGSIQRRLARGEAVLRKRLEQRGVALGVGTIATLLGSTTGAPAVPARLIESTARAAVAFRDGTLTGVTAEAAEKLLRALSWKGAMWKGLWLVMAGVCCLGAGGVGLKAWKMYVGGFGVVAPAESAAPEIVTLKTVSPKIDARQRSDRLDRFGDPLPEGALARIGTLRFRPRVEGDMYGGGIAFLPDGKTLVSLNSNSLYFWEWVAGKELRRLDGVHGGSIAVSPDGKMLAVGGEYWDLTATPPRRLEREKEPTLTPSGGVAFSPDSKTVAWAGQVKKGKLDHKVVYLMDASTGGVKRTLEDVDGSQLAFSTDGKTLAAGGEKTTVLWDVATGAKRLQIAGDDNPVSLLAFLHDGRTLLESRINGPSYKKWYESGLLERMRFLDTTTGAEQRSASAAYTPYDFCGGNGMGAKCISPDGKLLAVNSGLAVSVWDMATGREVGPAGGLLS